MGLEPERFLIFTLGCKVNQYESEQIRQALLDSGLLDAGVSSNVPAGSNSAANASLESAAAADRDSAPSFAEDVPPAWLIVNTCAVTQESEAKSRKLIRQTIKRRKPKNVLVFGCSAENNSEQYAQISGVTHIVTGKKHGGNRVAAVMEAMGLLPDVCANSLAGGLRRFGERHRAYIKVQDGCRQFCTYCLIPHLRNELTSVPEDEVLTETLSLLRNGYREIIVTGIHLGYYGLNPRSRTQNVWQIEDRTKPRETNLTRLMERLAKIELECPEFTARLESMGRPGSLDHLESAGRLESARAANSVRKHDFRLRISSLEAHEAGDDLLYIMAENRARVCPHLHLSMQSGSPTVHRRMNRPGTVEQYIERCEAAKRILDQPALTTDIIVGFPGETENEFLETCDVVRKVGFSKIHIFPFSARPGTPAEKMGGFVPNEEKHRRELYLAEIEREMREKFLQSLKHRKTQYLIERFHPETRTVTGTSEYYLQAEFPGTPEQVGTFLVR